MKNIQEVFSGRFSTAETAVVQKLEPTLRNVTNLQRGYTDHWAPVSPDTDLIAVEYLVKGEREVWVGRFADQQHSLTDDRGTKRYRLYVDGFDLVGRHDTMAVSDAEFYNLPKGGGGGARLLVVKTKKTRKPTRTEDDVAAPGEMVQRLVWLRKNHRAFRDPVAKHWQYQCAVTGAECNGLLVASHIKPWSMSTPVERTDKNNGLYLAAPLDALFDRGLIGFRPHDGHIVVRDDVLAGTRRIFGVTPNLALRRALVTTKMRAYLAWHLTRFSLA